MTFTRGPGPGHPGEEEQSGEPAGADRSAVALQLGREPRGGWRVARRCACGLPQVIETSPRLGDGTPFPTLWWLTCRALCTAVGRLEAGGWMAAVNRSLASDPEARAGLAGAVQRYVEARDAREVLPGKGHPGGGPDRVKCLHAHVAQELAGSSNLVGRAVLDELRWSDPDRPCVHVAPAETAVPAGATSSTKPSSAAHVGLAGAACAPGSGFPASGNSPASGEIRHPWPGKRGEP